MVFSLQMKCRDFGGRKGGMGAGLHPKAAIMRLEFQSIGFSSANSQWDGAGGRGQFKGAMEK